MGLTNPGRALGRSCLLLISPKLLSGIPLFSINSFRLASFLALLVGLNLFFLTGALVWFIKITKAAPFESVEVFRKDPFLVLFFSLFINDLSASLPSSLSCSLYADDLAIWSRSSQWIPSKLTSRPAFSYSAPASVSIPLQPFLGSPSTALFPFLSMYLR